MLALKRFRDNAKGVADLLNLAALRAPGTILCKDGSLLSGWFFAGPDAASMSPAQFNQLSRRVNDIFAKLGSGWAVWIDAARLPAADYPDRSQSHFSDPITQLIDEERRLQFRREGMHFETECALVVMYTPPLGRQQRFLDFMYDDDTDASVAPPSERQIETFNAAMADIEDALAEPLDLRRMSDFETRDEFGRRHLQDELVNYLQFRVTGELSGLNVPPCPMYLDQYLGGKELWTGDTPKIGDKFVSVVAIEGFPAESWPLILRHLTMLPIALCFSSRMIFLDQHDALSRLEAQRRKWKQKVRGFISQLFRVQGGYVNEDALLMADQAENAITDVNSNLVSFGYYTPTIVLMDESRETVHGVRQADKPRTAPFRLRRPGRDDQRHRGLAGLDPRPFPAQRPASAVPHPQLRRLPAVVGRMGGTVVVAQSSLSRWFAGVAARRHLRGDPIPLQPPCLGCRPHPDLRSDRRGQIHASGVDRRPVSPLPGRQGVHLRQGVLDVRPDLGGGRRDITIWPARTLPACVPWLSWRQRPMRPGPRSGWGPVTSSRPRSA